MPLKMQLNQRFSTDGLWIPKRHLKWFTINILFFINHWIILIFKVLKEIRGNEGVDLGSGENS